MPHIQIRTIAKKASLLLLALTLFSATPMAVFADDSTNCTAPDTSGQAGVHTPTGSDAGTFTYQCTGDYAGEWTNSYYAYSPTTNARTAIYNPNYGYDCTTNKWGEDEWDYNAGTGQYVMSRVATSQPYGYATNCPVAAPAASSSNPTANGSTPTGAATNNAASTTNGSSLVTGPGSNNNANTNINNNTGINNVNNANINNIVGGTATTGNALVLGNTTGGSAASGDAYNEANVINLLQSTNNAVGSGQKVATFTANINGDVTGDLLFDPSTLGSLQNASSNTNVNNNLTVNNSTNAALNNNINLASQSGNATVSGNTNGGNATSGTATAIANVMNYIDSAVTSGQSFIGTININGNLNGDILLPPNLIDQLIASNVPTVNVAIPAPNSTNTSNTNLNNSLTSNTTNNDTVKNNITSNAASGAATVSDNTGAGNAASGSATNQTNNVTAFNLTGSNVVGQNDILVFVNVLGKWLGMIVDAPAGATAAELGGGITQNTNVNNTATANTTNNEAINNNINVAAKSGDATVSDNTKGGNATSGKAATAVNLLNVEGSTLNLSNLFGILFINVFGNWNGSFGINTSAGDPATSASTTTTSTGTTTAIPASAVVRAKVFRFVPSTKTFATTTGSNGGITSDNITTPQAAVLAASTEKSSAKAPTPQLASTKNSEWKSAGVIGSLVVLYIVADAVISHRRKVTVSNK